MTDLVCNICGEPKSAHVATAKGPFTHPREARGEGVYENRSFVMGCGPWHDDEYIVRWVFVPTVAQETGAHE